MVSSSESTTRSVRQRSTATTRGAALVVAENVCRVVVSNALVKRLRTLVAEHHNKFGDPRFVGGCNEYESLLTMLRRAVVLPEVRDYHTRSERNRLSTRAAQRKFGKRGR